jgi:hypothetical protein
VGVRLDRDQRGLSMKKKTAPKKPATKAKPAKGKGK